MISKSQSSPWAAGYLEFTRRLTKRAMCAGCQESQEMLNKADFFPFHWPSRVGRGHYGFFLQASFWLDEKSGACSMNKKITRSKARHNGHFRETKIFPRRSRDWGQNVLSSNSSSGLERTSQDH